MGVGAGARGTGVPVAAAGRGEARPTIEAEIDTANDVSPRLRLANLLVGLIHLVQAGVVLALSNDFSLPLTSSFLAGPPGTTFTPSEIVRNVPVGPAVALFLLLAAVDHLLMAAPGVWPWYATNLRRGINVARWLEYSVSASLMIVLIALVSGVSDVVAVVAIFAANAAMILFGLVMEQVNRPDDEEVNWFPFLFGCIVGIVPWLLVVYQLVGSEQRAPGEGVPTFVYGIIVSLFVLFNSFAVNQALQYKRVGPWRTYVFGEKAYILLSLIAKTALAWQIFANTLVA